MHVKNLYSLHFHNQRKSQSESVISALRIFYMKNIFCQDRDSEIKFYYKLAGRKNLFNCLIFPISNPANRDDGPKYSKCYFEES